MIRRADIEGLKSDVATKAWPPQVTFLTPLGGTELSARKVSMSHAFTVRICTKNQDQENFCPFAARKVSVLAELALGHLRHRLTDVSPQLNSPPDTVSDRGRESASPWLTWHKTKLNLTQQIYNFYFFKLSEQFAKNQNTKSFLVSKDDISWM